MTGTASITTAQQIEVLLEEYRALYGLVNLRMASLDRRVPLAGVALSVTLGGALVAPLLVQATVLLVLPLALVWIVRTTVNHARSFEDALRRIEAIERQVNKLAGAELLAFQSRHPSRGRAVGGRTGRESVLAVLLAAGCGLAACVGLIVLMHGEAMEWRVGYLGYPTVVAGVIAHTVQQYTRYRYPESSSQ